MSMPGSLQSWVGKKHKFRTFGIYAGLFPVLNPSTVGVLSCCFEEILTFSSLTIQLNDPF